MSVWCDRVEDYILYQRFSIPVKCGSTVKKLSFWSLLVASWSQVFLYFWSNCLQLGCFGREMSDYRWPSTVTEFCVRSIVNDPQRFINVLVGYVVVLDSELKQERPIWTIHEERDVGSNWSCWRALCLGSVYNMWKWWISYSGSSYLWVKNILVEHVYAIHSVSISYLTTIWLYVCRIWISNLLFSHTQWVSVTLAIRLCPSSSLSSSLSSSSLLSLAWTF